MNKKSLMFIPMAAMLLSGCVGTKHFDSDSYIAHFSWDRTDFKVLTLGDIHFSLVDKYDDHFEVMQKTINASDPDLIVLNGDAFTFATKQTVDILFKWLDGQTEKLGHTVGWTFTFGNHDDQGQYADTWIPRQMSSGKYNYCVCPDLKELEADDVTGRTNFVINLEVAGTLNYQIYILDSHSYNFTKYEGVYKKEGMGYYYDFIKEDQVEWYKRMIDDTSNNVKSSAFFHIPVEEFNYLFDEDWNLKDEYRVKDGEEKYIGDGLEALVSSSQLPRDNTSNDLFNAIVAKNRLTQSITCSHDHINNFVCKYDDVYLTYGTHATDRIYFAKDKIGGQVMTIHQNQSIEFKNIFVTDLPNGYAGEQLL